VSRRSALDEPVFLPVPPVADEPEAESPLTQRDEVEMAADVIARLIDRGHLLGLQENTRLVCRALDLEPEDVNAALDRLDDSGWTPPVRAS
jgi:hypothetical protein